MNEKELTNVISRENTTILEAMKLIDINCKGILIIADENNIILGTITDGDIRRAILSGKSINSDISGLYNKNFIYVTKNTDINNIKKIFIEKKIRIIPILDENKRIIGCYEIDDLIDYNKIEKDNPVLIMAGGLGTRLRPLTNEMPKPMLKVGDKPILQTIIEQFRDYGFKNILISVNYKSDIIKNYFRDGKDFGVSINYITEEKRLGTAGAIKLAEEYIDKPFFVINGDILTNTSFYGMLQFHMDNKFSMTIGTRQYEMQVPFGVLDVKDDLIINSIEEKPIYSYSVSGGIYVLDPEIIRYIPNDNYFDITELINKLIVENQKVGKFELNDYWMDVGKIDDYYKANNDVGKVF